MISGIRIASARARILVGKPSRSSSLLIGGRGVVSSSAFNDDDSITTHQHSRQSVIRYLSSDIATQSSQLSPEARTSKDGVVGNPIDFDIASKIEGNESQILTVELNNNEVLRAESGAMMFMSEGVTMDTTTGSGEFKLTCSGFFERVSMVILHAVNGWD